ncbi:hypothetical protein CEXT_91781 [Caerostris extrusa]|uniref:Uncharacterized protein n=1 Tax=Caerostris extrusa TaxID=172846 RepID=A0AAV4Q3F8_CAEEX|nr:hypothetical protein CEXT_91781 [Caerostris extrusa]
MSDSKKKVLDNTDSSPIKASPTIIHLIPGANSGNHSLVFKTESESSCNTEYNSGISKNEYSNVCIKENDELSYSPTKLNIESGVETSKSVEEKTNRPPRMHTRYLSGIEISKNYESSVLEESQSSRELKFEKDLNKIKSENSRDSHASKNLSTQSKKRKISRDFKTTSEHGLSRSLNVEKDQQERFISRSVEPPLVMQSSNFLNENRLDVRYDGGGIATTVLETNMEPLKKKSKHSKSRNKVSASTLNLEKDDQILAIKSHKTNEIGRKEYELKELLAAEMLPDATTSCESNLHHFSKHLKNESEEESQQQETNVDEYQTLLNHMKDEENTNLEHNINQEYQLIQMKDEPINIDYQEKNINNECSVTADIDIKVESNDGVSNTFESSLLNVKIEPPNSLDTIVVQQNRYKEFSDCSKLGTKNHSPKKEFQK